VSNVTSALTRFFGRAGLFALVPLAVLPLACGDEFNSEGMEPRCEADGALPCNEDPWVCELGQNCWIGTDGNFACLNLGAAEQDGSCQAVNGSSTCSQDQGCVQLSGEPAGTCRTYCDTSDSCKACRSGFNCVPIMFPNGGLMSFCLPG
jgi:hypothetical protein